jgi:exodeoxyribonuclease VII small subunit
MCLLRISIAVGEIANHPDTDERCCGALRQRLVVRNEAHWAVRFSMASKQNASDVGTLTFEAALQELEGIVARLEQGQVDLEDSIVLYERGQALKLHCESKLKAAESRLEKIVQSNGKLAGEATQTE